MAVPWLCYAEDSANRWAADAPDVLNYKIGYLNPSLRMNTRTGSGTSAEDNPVDFNPPNLTKLFFGLSYRNLGAALSFSTPQSPEDQAKYGSGTALDLQVNLYGEKLTQQYFYQSYNGYYIGNSGTIDPSLPDNTYIKRPDIHTQHYGANFIYNFQPEKYSMAVAYDQTGRQTEKGGAWLAELGVHNHRFSANPHLLPATIAPKFGELATLESGDIFQASLLGGYGYTFPFFENWYVSAQVLFGFGAAYQQFETDDYVYKRSGSSSVGAGTFALGYNGKNDYFIMEAWSDSYTYDLPDMKLQITSQQVSIHYGHRLREMNIPILNTVSSWLD